MGRDSIYTKLQSVLNLFTVQEISDVALHKFRKISWTHLQDRIIQQKCTLTKKNIIRILLNIVQENETSSDELEQLISTLSLIGTAKSKTKIWVTFRLLDKSDYNIAVDDIFDSIRGSIKRQGILADITTETLDSRHALSIRRNILMAVVEGLGYSKYKTFNLTGKNVFELFKMLQNMHGSVNNCKMLLASSTFKPTFSINENGMDFGQRAERAKYAEQLYGASPPEIQTLSVTIKDAVWQSDVLDMQGEPMHDVKLTLRAPSTIELIKQLITEGMVTMPVPQYMQAILNSGKNDLKLIQNTETHSEKTNAK
ncbi:hypothetical protein CBL_08773 [Carabus blaptoides fortunei]